MSELLQQVPGYEQMVHHLGAQSVRCHFPVAQSRHQHFEIFPFLRQEERQYLRKCPGDITMVSLILLRHLVGLDGNVGALRFSHLFCAVLRLHLYLGKHNVFPYPLLLHRNSPHILLRLLTVLRSLHSQIRTYLKHNAYPSFLSLILSGLNR